MQLFFDFDGTLADSSPGIYASFEFACKCQGLNAPAYAVFCSAIGPPVQVLARHFFPQLSATELETFRQTFRQDYDQDRFRFCHWYDGVEPTLLALSQIPSARLAIITNKPTIPTVELLKVAGLLHYFEIVVGLDFPVIQESGPIFTQKSEAIHLAKRRLPSDTPIGFYIGDTPSDQRASVDCGLEFIAATYGFHCWQDVELNGICHLASINDLVPCIQAAVWRQQADPLSE